MLGSRSLCAALTVFSRVVIIGWLMFRIEKPETENFINFSWCRGFDTGYEVMCHPQNVRISCRAVCCVLYLFTYTILRNSKDVSLEFPCSTSRTAHTHSVSKWWWSLILPNTFTHAQCPCLCTQASCMHKTKRELLICHFREMKWMAPFRKQQTASHMEPVGIAREVHPIALRFACWLVQIVSCNFVWILCTQN